MKNIATTIRLALPAVAVILLATHLVVGVSGVFQLGLLAVVVGLAGQSYRLQRQLRVLKLRQAINAHANRETRIKSQNSGCFPTTTVS